VRVLIREWYRTITKTIAFYSPMSLQPAMVGPGPFHYPGFMITLRHTTLGKTPLDECSTRHEDL